MKSLTPTDSAPSSTAALALYHFTAPSDHVVLSMPRSAHELALETLQVDAQSSAFDRSLRAEISAALDSITEQSPTAPDPGPIGETDDAIAALLDIALEGDLWENTLSMAELRQTVRNMRNTAKNALAAANVTPLSARHTRTPPPAA